MSDQLGFAGLGAMGGGMARQLMKAGRHLVVFDPNPEAQQALESEGAAGAGGAGELAEQCSVVHTSLSSPAVFASVYETELLPRARQGQVFIDHTTAQVEDVRRLAEALAAKGAALIDAPVSGGPGGASAGTLRVFVGGDADAVKRVQADLDVIGGNVAHCGPSGAGQAAKIINQLGMGLSNAIYLEAMALGVKAGLDPETIATVVGAPKGDDEPWRVQLAQIARTVAEGKAQWSSVKQAQLDDFLADAAALGITLPITQAVADACRDEEKVVREANRMAASYWRALEME